MSICVPESYTMYHLEIIDQYRVSYCICKIAFPNINERYLCWCRAVLPTFCLPENCLRYVSLTCPLFKESLLEEYFIVFLLHAFPGSYYELFEFFFYFDTCNFFLKG